MLGKFVGYDRYLHIQDWVENACQLRSAKHPGTKCGEVGVTMLPSMQRECSGQVYFVYDGTYHRVL